jgi:hypothetical protein
MRKSFRAALASLAALLAALLVAAVAPAQRTDSSRALDLVPASITKTCGAGYKHGAIGGAEKCLRVEEFCAHRYDRQYRQYGFRCTRYDANVNRYRLTHA